MIIKNDIIKTYAIQSKNLDTINSSTSGGTFFEIASKIIQHNGYVCAAGFDSSGMVVHKVVNRIDELRDLQGSKYVQSNIGNTFRIIKDILLNNKMILFVGTPCQVAGLKAFLEYDYSNLYTIDLICFGVPSPLVYKAWRCEIVKKYNKDIKEIAFRDKSYGYSAPNVKIFFKDLSYVEQNYIVKSYMKTFMSEINVRPSCSECKFKGCERVSDITLGDCWHIGSFDKSMDDNTGVTSVFIHTVKGDNIIDWIKKDVRIVEIPTEKEIQLDGKKMLNSVMKNPYSSLFYSDVETKGYLNAVKKWAPYTVKDAFVSWIKLLVGKSKFIKILLKKIRGR